LSKCKDEIHLEHAGAGTCKKCGYMRNYKVELTNCQAAIEQLWYDCPNCGKLGNIY